MNKKIVTILSLAFAQLLLGTTPNNITTSPPMPETLSLQEALDYALENNFRIKLAKEMIYEQKNLIVDIRSSSLPQLSAVTSYHKKDEGLIDSGNNNFGGQNDEDWRIAIELRQAIYAGGSNTHAIRREKEAYEAAIMDMKTIVNDITYEVKIRYYDLLLAKEQIQVQEQNVILLKQELENARNRFEYGSVSQFEVLRAEVLLSNAMPKLIKAENQFKIAADKLRHTLGYQNNNYSSNEISKVPDFVETLTYEPAQFSLSVSLFEALDNRPELKRLDHIVKARKSNISVADGLDRPSIDLIGAYSYQNANQSTGFSDALKGWTVGIEGSWAIFDGMDASSKMKQAESQYRQSQLNYQDQKLSIEVEVRQAFSLWEESEQLVAASKKVIAQAEEALRLANARYEAGSATQLDVLQSQVSLTDARIQQLEAYYKHLVAIAQMEKATAQFVR